MKLADSNALDKKRFIRDVEKIIHGIPLNFIYLDSCESTNIECLKQAEHNTIVIAEYQSAGRGRRGKNWHSPSSKNIYCSIGLRKTIKAEYLGLISLQVGVSIVNVLHEMGFAEVGLKWPNDILLHGKKLGGILIETKALTPDNFYLVIGFGLNVKLESSDLEQINQPAVGLNQLSSQLPDRQQLITALSVKILQDVMKFDLHLIDSLIEKFSLCDQLHGKEVVVKTSTEEIMGTYLGVLQTGQIRLRTQTGVESFAAAEISLRGL